MTGNLFRFVRLIAAGLGPFDALVDLVLLVAQRHLGCLVTGVLFPFLRNQGATALLEAGEFASCFGSCGLGLVYGRLGGAMLGA